METKRHIAVLADLNSVEVLHTAQRLNAVIRRVFLVLLFDLLIIVLHDWEVRIAVAQNCIHFTRAEVFYVKASLPFLTQATSTVALTTRAGLVRGWRLLCERNIGSVVLEGVIDRDDFATVEERLTEIMRLLQ